MNESIVARFTKSMEVCLDKWRDGEGYDLSLLKGASELEKKTIETILIAHLPRNWRDIEALATIGSPQAREALQDAFQNGDTQLRLAVHRYAPDLLTDKQRLDSILDALQVAEIYTGLSETLDEIEEFHPPEVLTALLRGLIYRDGATACHFAAMLYYLHGKSSSAFDWDHRPFFLRFNTENSSDREQAVRELCAVIGVDPACCF